MKPKLRDTCWAIWMLLGLKRRLWVAGVWLAIGRGSLTFSKGCNLVGHKATSVTDWCRTRAISNIAYVEDIQKLAKMRPEEREVVFRIARQLKSGVEWN